MMTDAQLNAAIDAVKPELRTAIRAISTGKAVDIFEFLNGTNSETGVQSKIMMIVAHEAPAALLEATVNGMVKCSEIYARLMGKAAAADYRAKQDRAVPQDAKGAH